MFTNSEGCTVWEKTERNRAPAYIRHETGPVYWEETTGQRQSQKGTGTDRSSANQALVVIASGNLGAYLPKPDDRIANGLHTDEQPPPKALTVTAVRDFRYGSAMVQHIEVTAE